MPACPEPARNLLKPLPTLALLAVCLSPYLARLRSPSLYADDIDRITQLQTVPLGRMLFLPFNEHVAPLFQAISWLAWQSAGQRLAWAPLTFTLASFLPFVPTLALLALVVRRETRSTLAALACVAIFSLSWLSIETVYWYSASSFLWALLMTLIAWLSPRPLVMALASAAAPMFSAVGLLAGPVAAVKLLASATGRNRSVSDDEARAPLVEYDQCHPSILVGASGNSLGATGRTRPVSDDEARSSLVEYDQCHPKILRAWVPLLGTLAAVVLYASQHDRAALASNVGRSSGLWLGLIETLRAPAVALVPAVLGLKTWQATIVPIALTVLVSLALLERARRGHDRPLILGGLLLIFGGYALTFCARAGELGQPLVETQRYHLFPMLGLVFVLAPFLKRIPGNPWIAIPLALLLFLLHSSEMKARAHFLRFPDQGRTFAAIDRLSQTCQRLRITRAQALSSLDPIETAWTPRGRNALVLLAPGVDSPNVPDALVRSKLLASLSPDDLRSLCGGMDATPYLVSADSDSPVSVARRVALYRVKETGENRYESNGWPAYIEYELPSAPPADARALALAGTHPGDVVEVWWRNEHQRWSETRSVRLRPQVDRPWLLPLDRLPHWNPADVRRLRLLFHATGSLAVSAPRLVR